MMRNDTNISFKIGNKSIGKSFKPFIIAEMSGNHNQSLEKALEIVDAAADSGADAIKLQTYTADTMTMDLKGGSFTIKDKNSLCILCIVCIHIHYTLCYNKIVCDSLRYMYMYM